EEEEVVSLHRHFLGSSYNSCGEEMPGVVVRRCLPSRLQGCGVRRPVGVPRGVDRGRRGPLPVAGRLVRQCHRLHPPPRRRRLRLRQEPLRLHPPRAWRAPFSPPPQPPRQPPLWQRPAPALQRLLPPLALPLRQLPLRPLPRCRLRRATSPDPRPLPERLLRTASAGVARLPPAPALAATGEPIFRRIPAGVWAEMSKLVQLDLSSNDFEGPIPPDLGELDSLGGTLNLSHNRLSGAIPSELGNLPSTVILDLRYNNLSGEIPGTGSLANQSPTAFLDNPGLCGFPLTITCDGPVGAPAAAEEEEGRRGMKAGLIAVISVADAAGVALVGLVLVCAYWKVKNQQKGRAKLGHGGAGLGRRWCLFPCGAAMAEKKDGMSSSEEEDDHGGGVEGELVAMDKGFKVELEELLRASAYVLGKGGKGIVYKVVVGDGVAVAVRRLGEGGGGKYKEFAAEVRAMGRVRHPNVVRLRAFYWAPDEKLLITDFISNGNLAAVLRGRSGQPNLSWAVRLRIARGAARGLAHLHDCSPRKLVHGDLKPSNILLDADFNPYISDFGLLRLLPLTSSAATNPTSAPSYSSTAGLFGPVPSSAQPTLLDRPNPYRAPETRAAGHPTHKSDVYSFGLVLLEILTGKQPEMPSSSAEQVAGLVRWVRKGFEEARPPSELVDPALLQEVHAREEVVAAFHVALACTETDPDVRPRMKAVSEDLDRIGSWRK
ncbi:unnamed protein product, partial [Musa textilis]